MGLATFMSLAAFLSGMVADEGAGPPTTLEHCRFDGKQRLYEESQLEGLLMIRAISTLAFLFIVTSASAESLTLAPKYDAAGTNPDGSKYTGTATVDLLSDTTFAIQWSIGGSIYKGFGMRRNDTLAATYMIDGEPGLVIYKVDGNGLDGLWAVKGENGNGTERLTPSK